MAERMANYGYLTFQGQATAEANLASHYAAIDRLKPIRRDSINKIYGNLILCEGFGKKYGSWITENSRSIDGLTTADYIKNPAHIIEDIARTAGVPTHKIDTTGIDSAYTSLDTAGYEFAGVINAKEKWKQVVGYLAWMSRCWAYFDNTDGGKFTVRYHDSSANFTQSGTGTPGNNDIFTSSPTLSAGVFSQHPIELESFSVIESDKQEVINQVYVNYHINYATGQLLRTAFIEEANSDDGTGTRDESGGGNREEDAENSQIYKYGTYDEPYKIPQEFNCAWIRKSSVAVLVRNAIFDMHVNRRLICAFNTWTNIISNDSERLRLGDVINIRHDWLETKVGGSATMNSKKWVVTDIGLSLDGKTSTIRAWELV